MVTFTSLDSELAAAGGTVSVWCGGLDAPPAYTRLPHQPHYPASTMKIAVMVALYRLADAGELTLDTEVPLHNDFPSEAPGGTRFGLDPEEDSDTLVWDRLGGTATLRWLTERMIVRSGNLATDLVWEHVGAQAVADAWQAAGATHSYVRRGIEDYQAERAGISNRVTAADLAKLLSAIVTGHAASASACDEMREILLSQEHSVDLPAGLPPGTRIAHKNGWIPGVRHGAGIVFPDDAPPYALVVCTTTDRPDEEMVRLLARVATASWQARHDLQAG